MTDGMTREDLREALRDMNLSINRGFDGINDRLDTLNGKTARLESSSAVHEERWQRLDRATSTSVKSGSSPTPEEMGLNKDWKTLTMAGSLAAGAVSGLVWGLFKVAQFIGAITKP